MQKPWLKTIQGLATLVVIVITSNSLYPSAAFAQTNNQANGSSNEPSHTETLSQPNRETNASLASSTMQLSGQFHGFIPATNRFLTYHRETDSSVLHDEQGREIAVMIGRPILFSPDGERIITSGAGSGMEAPSTNYLYDALGNEIAVLEGFGAGYSPDSQYFVTIHLNNRTTNLYNSAGEKIATLTGYFGGFSPNAQQIATREVPELPPAPLANPSRQTSSTNNPSELTETHLYDITGNYKTTITGLFSAFNHDGSRIVTYDAQEVSTYLYDNSGRELAILPDQLSRGFYGEESILATTTQYGAASSRQNTLLYDRDGGQIAILEGYLDKVNEAETHFVTDYSTSSNLADNTDYLYDLSGRQIAAFPDSTYWAFTQEGALLLSNSLSSSITNVYDVSTGDELAVLNGSFAAISPEGNQFVVYTEFGGERSHFFDESANPLQSIPGIFSDFSPMGDLMAIVETWDESVGTVDEALQGIDGNVDTLENAVETILEIGDRLAEFINPTTHIYDQAGNKIALLAGNFEQFSEDGSRVVTYELSEDFSEQIYYLNILPLPQ